MLKNPRFWIGLAISLVFLFLFLYRTDFAEMGRALGEANYVFLLPGFLVYLVGVFLRGVRWRQLLKPLGTFSPFRLFPLVVIGFMVNNLVPGRLGIVARAYILGEKEGVSKMATAGTMVVEQLFDGLTLVLFAAVIALFVPLTGLLQQTVSVAAGLFLAALVLIFVLAASRKLTDLAIGIVLRLLPRRWRKTVGLWLAHLVVGLAIMRSPKRLALILAVSMAVWVCESGLFYLVSLSFGLQQPFHVMVLVTSIASLSWALIFVAPGGVGPFDWFIQQTLLFFVPVGFAAAEYGDVVTAYVIVLHAMLLLPMIALGFVFLWSENVSLTRVVPQAKEEVLAEGDGPAGGEG